MQIERLAEAEEGLLQAILLAPEDPGLTLDANAALGELALERGGSNHRPELLRGSPYPGHGRRSPCCRCGKAVTAADGPAGGGGTASLMRRLPGIAGRSPSPAGCRISNATRPSRSRGCCGRPGWRDQEEQWHQYLLNPRDSEDPTAARVIVEFGAGPEHGAVAAPAGLSRRYTALGEFYNRQRRFAEARQALDVALGEAVTDRQQAEAMRQIAYCVRRVDGRAAARADVEQAAGLWLQILNQPVSEGEKHEAIDMVVECYSANGFREEALAILERINDSLATDTPASVVCFAKYRLMLEYRRHDRPAEAKALAQSILTTYLAAPFAQGHDTLCGNTLIQLAYMRAHESDAAAAQATLDELGRRWPGRFGPRLATLQASVEKVALAAGREY